MTAYAMISSGAYIASYSKTYWAVNAYFYFHSKAEDWIISMFGWSWYYVLRLLLSRKFNLDSQSKSPKKHRYFLLRALVKSYGL
jgi:hypothetical protein